ncbi:hypothetical protein JXB02_03055 [Candidatus Woesearchaeota archaeon]|nr:hypothetical protein [Candidatus Woesearchaeota archaeon]
MKHTPSITAVLILVFFVAQVTGLIVTASYVDAEATIASGEIVAKALPGGIERPEVDHDYTWLYIIIAVLIGTVLALWLVRHRKMQLWKLWFFLAVTLCLAIAFSAFMDQWAAAVLAVVLATLKVWKRDVIVHNFTELFIYGGLAAIFAPIISIFSAFMLLVLIAFYDIYAVWKSKHMVALAEFQTAAKLFAGIMVPYHLHQRVMKIHPAPFPGQERQDKGASAMEKTAKAQKSSKAPAPPKLVPKNAILGGGDIGFPLIFAAVVMNSLVLVGIPLQAAFFRSLLIPVFATLALAGLFYFGKKDRYYPAMPFIGIGCLIGYFIIFALHAL